MADVATLGLSVDSSKVDKGRLALDQLSNSAKRAEVAAVGVANGANNAAAALNAEGVAAQKAAQAMNRHIVAANQNSAAAKGSGLQMRMMAMQLSQVAQQTQATGNFMQALAIQLPDLALGFGTVGIALGVMAGVLLPLIPAGHLAAGALNAIADVLPTVAPYAVAAAAGLALLYAPAIIGGLTLVSELILGLTARLIGLAAGFAMANPGVAFVAGITAAVVAATIFRDELTRILGVDVVGAAKTGANFVIGAFVAAYEDIKFLWNQFPNIIGAAAVGAANAAISAMEKMINAASEMLNGLIASLNDALGKLPGGFAIGEVGKVSFGQIDNPFSKELSGAVDARNKAVSGALNADYLGDFGGAIANGASAASDKLRELAGWMTTVDEKGKKKRGGGKTEAEKYSDIVDGANRRIASLQAEYNALGMTEQAAAKLAYETDLLNEAQRKGINLTAAQRAELSSLADHMATLEIATKNARDAMDFAKDLTKGFISDLRSGLEQGKGFWESFGNAALNVLDKITDKLLDDVLDAIFKVGSAGSSSGGGGFWGILGGLFGLGGGGGGGLSGLTWDSWATGGFTGQGGKYEPAGMVHKGEYVFSAAATKAIGVGNLDRAHRRARGYAEGGYVDGNTPRMFSPANGNSAPVTVRLIMPAGWKAEIVGEAKNAARQDTVQIVSDFNENLPVRVQQINGDQRVR